MRIAVENLKKSYGEQQVLNDVTFAAAEEKITCIMAPSGVGKTTLLRDLARQLATPPRLQRVCVVLCSVKTIALC